MIMSITLDDIGAGTGALENEGGDDVSDTWLWPLQLRWNLGKFYDL